MHVAYLETGVRPWMANVIESPRFSLDIPGVPVEVSAHAINPWDLKDAHGDGPILPRCTMARARNGTLIQMTAKKNTKKRERDISYNCKFIRTTRIK